MERNQELFELLERYLQEKLNPSDLLAFEKRLEEDSEFKREVEKHVEMEKALEDFDILDFRKKIQKIEKTQSNPHTLKRTRPTFLKIAATVLILIGLSTFLWVKSNSDVDLFQVYYDPYPIEDVVRGIDDEIIQPSQGENNGNSISLKEILTLYTKGKYAKAIPFLVQLTEKYPQKEIFQLYLANCYLNTGEESGALSIFKNFLKDSPFHEDAQWYLALTYLKLNNIPRTQSILEYLIGYQGIYEERARSLLLKIEASEKQ